MTIMQAKNKLPLDFIEELERTYNKRIVDKILMGMLKKRLTTLRVNTLKYDIDILIKSLEEEDIQFDKVLWYKDALIIKNAEEREIQKLDIYKKGCIYIQSLSSMIPPIVLNPKENEKVLDLTAAPGSKTTQMACMMNNKGYILANELDKIRCNKLRYNVNMQSANIVEVVNGRGEDIGERYKTTFDKVLLDTPCSGEGRFIITDANTYKFYSSKQIEELTKVQKSLFGSAYKALKIGGQMVYSTCTLNKKENEDILNWAIKNYNMEILDININLKDSIKAFSKGVDKSIEKALMVLPSKSQEGFFIAKLKKI